MINVNEKLQNGLTNCIKIYVPNTVNINRKLIINKYKKETAKFMAETFGGSTSYKGQGSWISEAGEMVTEKVQIVYAYMDQETYEKKIGSVLEYVEKLKEKMSQECISVEINNVLYFI